MNIFKSLILTFFLLFAGFYKNLEASVKSNVLKDVRNLIDERQYESAFYLLENFDPDNERLDFVLKKAKLAFEYYTLAIQHQYFVFTDLEEDEELEKLRAEGAAGDYKLFVFPFNEILEDWALREPEETELHKWLGRFYHLIYGYYGDEWLIPAEDQLLRAEYHLSIHAGATASPYPYSPELAFVKIMLQNYAEAVYWLEQARQFYPDDGEVLYNSAAAYFYTRNYEQANHFAKKAVEAYEHPQLKADAYRLSGVAYIETGDARKSVEQYQKALDLSPEDYMVKISLLDAWLYMERNYRARRLALRIFDMEPENAGIAQDILNNYIEHSAYRPLKRFFNRTQRRYRNNDEVIGNLYFHEGRLHLHLEDYQTARQKFFNAKNHFETVLDEYHYVFDIIEEVLNQIDVLE